MVRTLARSATIALAFAVALPAVAAQKDDIQKPLKVVIQSVRYSKDKAALKQFANDAQGKALLGEAWDKADAKQKKEFSELFQVLFAKIAFPKIRENFQHLGAMNYDEPKVEGDKASVASTLVIEHPLKKQELKLKYQLVKNGSSWQVVDVAVLGDSMLAGIREEQVQPLMKEGGMDLLLERMREKARELEKVPLK